MVEDDSGRPRSRALPLAAAAGLVTLALSVGAGIPAMAQAVQLPGQARTTVPVINAQPATVPAPLSHAASSGAPSSLTHDPAHDVASVLNQPPAAVPHQVSAPPVAVTLPTPAAAVAPAAPQSTGPAEPSGSPSPQRQPAHGAPAGEAAPVPPPAATGPGADGAPVTGQNGPQMTEPIQTSAARRIDPPSPSPSAPPRVPSHGGYAAVQNAPSTGSVNGAGPGASQAAGPLGAALLMLQLGIELAAHGFRFGDKRTPSRLALPPPAPPPKHAALCEV